MSLLCSMAVSLALTIAVELIVAVGWGLRDRWNLSVAVLCNLLTNPPVVALYAVLTSLQMAAPAVTAVLEAAAVVVEWRCYARCGREVPHPLRLSLLANALSYGVGAAATLFLKLCL